MKTKFRVMGVAVAVVALLAFGGGAAAKELVFMTGSPGGSWQAFGGVAQNIFAKSMPTVTISVLPGGSGNNIMGIELGKAQLGLSNSFTSVTALKGAAPFKGPVKRIRHLLTLWPQWFQMVAQAESNIYTVKDLKGKRLVTLKRGSAGEEGTRDVLSVYGLKYDDLSKVDYQGSGSMAEAMVDGHADVGASVGPVPASYFTQIAESRKVRFIGIGDKLDELNKMNPGYLPDVLPAGAYRGIDKEVPTVSMWVHLIASADMDEQLAYDITKMFVENEAAIRAMGKGMEDVVPKNMVKYVGLEFHPGAKRYFREAGLLK